jgi:hypothetical protein
MEKRRYPLLLEVNTRLWLSGLSRQEGRKIGLAEVEDSALDGFAARGFDWIWLLGVWQTGTAGQQLWRADHDLHQEIRTILPDAVDGDIGGSPFAIAAYRVDEAFGGAAGLANFRARLAARGLRLMLDFVPNHTALDHPWVRSQPTFYVHGSEQTLASSPGNYLRVETDMGPEILAHGRDPNFPGWGDTLQLNYANPDLQAAQMAELTAIAELCDGLRCDMAMLLLPDIFERSWGLTPEPFWPKAISAVRARNPDFTFMAEVYWDLEWALQKQGFDYCYDKRLYDRLRAAPVSDIRAHLEAGLDYQDKLARFLENHDEPRAAATFPLERHRAAAVVTFFAPGLRFFHAGQLTGAQLRIPVQLRRCPAEPADRTIETFYSRLLAVLKSSKTLHDGSWSQIEPQRARPENPTADDFIAFAWADDAAIKHLVVVNYAGHRGQCYLRLPYAEMRGKRLRLIDEMGIEVYERDGSALVDAGLYIDLAAWRFNVFRIESSGV